MHVQGISGLHLLRPGNTPILKILFQAIILPCQGNKHILRGNISRGKPLSPSERLTNSRLHIAINQVASFSHSFSSYTRAGARKHGFFRLSRIEQKYQGP
uniref:Uncharacterized protein n=1 Tax=Siphoviridae sp. ct6bU4 TaxID=2825344 RepID=A0A8S5VAH8_9CAUD|nr:MAG TPA: hypothetical protein [Siphoviridae sp. ct6bU4]